MQLVVPMAGAGQRFRDAGYRQSKPFIPVSGIPMVVRAVQGLPRADRVIFVCRAEHLVDDSAREVLSHYFPGCRLVVAPALTDGQACSVRLSAEHLDPHQPVLVAACDNTHVYSRSQFQLRTQDPRVDALIWTYRGEPRVQVKPQQYGWVRTEGKRVLGVSVKQPISSHPIEDHAISGCFWFRRAALMLDAIDALVAADRRVNGEFYLDSVPNLLLEGGRRVEVFEVRKYIGWGTPADLEDYRRWESYFSGSLSGPLDAAMGPILPTRPDALAASLMPGVGSGELAAVH